LISMNNTPGKQNFVSHSNLYQQYEMPFLHTKYSQQSS